MQVKIDSSQFKFPQPKYHFGQELVDSEGDKAIIIGMSCNTEEWSYEPWYPEMGCLGNSIKESDLERIAIDVSSNNVDSVVIELPKPDSFPPLPPVA